AGVDHIECANGLEAALREVRLIHEHRPRYNRQGKDWSRYRWVKLTLTEGFPRLAIARVARADGSLYLGPVGSQRVAQRIIDALPTAFPLRRCTRRPGRDPVGPVCTAAQMGVATCPCSGSISEEDYRHIVDVAAAALRGDLEPALAPLRDRIR